MVAPASSTTVAPPRSIHRRPDERGAGTGAGGAAVGGRAVAGRLVTGFCTAVPAGASTAGFIVVFTGPGGSGFFLTLQVGAAGATVPGAAVRGPCVTLDGAPVPVDAGGVANAPGGGGIVDAGTGRAGMDWDGGVSGPIGAQA